VQLLSLLLRLDLHLQWYFEHFLISGVKDGLLAQLWSIFFALQDCLLLHTLLQVAETLAFF